MFCKQNVPINSCLLGAAIFLYWRLYFGYFFVLIYRQLECEQVWRYEEDEKIVRQNFLNTGGTSILRALGLPSIPIGVFSTAVCFFSVTFTGQASQKLSN